ncbi:MAG: hypothetical protein EP330_09610 [Deltaproteobacteria bacterium]|nr:MAG: hypothetical protein EP330_09610 [Deltaproteobacteria bacterium]
MPAYSRNLLVFASLAAGCSWGEVQEVVPAEVLPPALREAAAPPPAPLPTWSRVQGRFLEVRGNPVAYTVMFVDQQVDEQGRVLDTATRRTDAWVYEDVVDVFDAGFFVQEKKLATRVKGKPTRLSPAFFAAGTQPEDLIAKLGPGEERSSAMGPIKMQMLHWDEPEVVTAAWLDGTLASVVVGMGVAP